ncbi:MAG: hypothetical protein U1F17_02120 [Burkholderiaceae bacterium]
MLGTSFIPEMKEGAVSPNMDRVPNISLNESLAMEMEAVRLVKQVPGVKRSSAAGARRTVRPIRPAPTRPT